MNSEYYNGFVDRQFIGEDAVYSDSIVTEVCRKQELLLPEFKINAYMSADLNAIRLFVNFFFMTGCDTPARDTRFGTMPLGAIHCAGMDSGFITHESVHMIWQKSLPARRQRVAERKYTDLLPITGP